jgi:Tol biopolymer transport system component
MRIQFSNRRARALVCALAALASSALAACAAAQPTAAPTPPALPQATAARPRNPAVEPTPPGSLNLKGHFVFATGDGGLSVEQAGSNSPRVVFKATSTLYADAPALSPDGKQIAFSASSFTKEGAVLQDVRVMNIDGTNLRVVAAPAQPKITLGFPAWSPDGTSLYITQSYSTPPATQHDEIDQVSVNGGALHKVIENAREASLSPDGKKIVYSQLNLNTYSSSLWMANIDGSHPQQLLADGVFAAIYGPRFSPDMRTIVFAESGPATQKLPGAYAFNRFAPDDSCAVALAFICLVEKADAHGLPWDLWLIHLDTLTFEQLTHIGADSPVPAWSADGKQIAFFDATGIYILDVATKKIHQVSDSRGYGGFDWR